jgi:hypothetical protein
MFDPTQYLLKVHKETDSATFYQGISAVKAKSVSSSSAQQSLQTKKDLVMTNYVQFLAAKMTLDEINRKFLSAREIDGFLSDLEESMKQLRTKSQLKLLPLLEHLERIQDCALTQSALQQIALLLRLNRAISLALAEEDDLPKAIGLLQRERGLLARAYA